MSPLEALMPTHARLLKRLDSLHRLEKRVQEFQQKRFPKQTLKAKLEHCKREIGEILANPEDVAEWADAFLLLIAAARKNGLSVDDLIAAGHAKMDKNFLRKWGPADEHGVHHHIEERND